ncbi:hypothetical protein IV48_GL000243 [Fructilactobacillus fructivorans]|nr:hypothetical protein IV37_GL000553 [Fructilactobacillus fructivorans]KRN42480.1 hypothetical protein IV48_GL000243 [Fructilactobacillus fructivorans]
MKWKELKSYLYSYLFHFDLLVTLLVSIVYEVDEAVKTNHVPILKVDKDESFMDKIKSAVPEYNDRQVTLAS